MAIHLLAAKHIEAATSGQLRDGEGLTLRIAGGQGRWWYRYTAPSGQRRAMSLGAAIIRGDRELIEASFVQAREIAAEARSLLVRGTDRPHGASLALAAPMSECASKKLTVVDRLS